MNSESFRAFDTDGDGRVSKNEFKRYMLNFGEKFDEEDFEEMFRMADFNDLGPKLFTRSENLKFKNPKSKRLEPPINLVKIHQKCQISPPGGLFLV